jgi:hypothetical protein
LRLTKQKAQQRKMSNTNPNPGVNPVFANGKKFTFLIAY